MKKVIPTTWHMACANHFIYSYMNTKYLMFLTLFPTLDNQVINPADINIFLSVYCFIVIW